jgi:hypothetical protein
MSSTGDRSSVIASSLEKSFAWFEQLGWIHSSLIADCRLAISRLTIDD